MTDLGKKHISHQIVNRKYLGNMKNVEERFCQEATVSISRCNIHLELSDEFQEILVKQPPKKRKMTH